jgi:hypothetical protein
MLSPMKRIPSSNDLIQQAWVVDDLEAAMHRWTRHFGVGPFFVLEHAPMENLVHRGVPVKLDCDIALAQSGRMQVELIAQKCNSPSIYRDYVPPGSSAFHHVAVICEDYDADLAHYRAQGFDVATTGTFGDLRFGYVDTMQALGTVLEVLEDKPSLREHFRIVADAARNWDGKRPVRPFE